MGAYQRRKGANFERDIATAFRDALPGLNIRRSMQADRAHEPDVVIDAPLEYPYLRRVWHELTCGAKPDPIAKMAQAERDKDRVLGQRIPVVIWHKTSTRVINVTMHFEDMYDLGSDSLVGNVSGNSFRMTLVTFHFCEYIQAIHAYYNRRKQ